MDRPRSSRSVPGSTSSHEEVTTPDAPATDLGVLYELNAKLARKRWVRLAGGALLKIRTSALQTG
jgi:hypothetical protein